VKSARLQLEKDRGGGWACHKLPADKGINTGKPF